MRFYLTIGYKNAFFAPPNIGGSGKTRLPRPPAEGER